MADKCPTCKNLTVDWPGCPYLKTCGPTSKYYQPEYSIMEKRLEYAEKKLKIYDDLYVKINKLGGSWDFVAAMDKFRKQLEKLDKSQSVK